MPASLLLALVVVAPLVFTAVMGLPTVTMDMGTPKFLVQVIGGLIAIIGWVWLHSYAIELHRGWWDGIAMWNTLMVMVNLCALICLGFGRDSE